jgi:hypothetical protein
MFAGLASLGCSVTGIIPEGKPLLLKVTVKSDLTDMEWEINYESMKVVVDTLEPILGYRVPVVFYNEDHMSISIEEQPK